MKNTVNCVLHGRTQGTGRSHILLRTYNKHVAELGLEPRGHTFNHYCPSISQSPSPSTSLCSPLLSQQQSLQLSLPIWPVSPHQNERPRAGQRAEIRSRRCQRGHTEPQPQSWRCLGNHLVRLLFLIGEEGNWGPERGRFCPSSPGQLLAESGLGPGTPNLQARTPTADK